MAQAGAGTAEGGRRSGAALQRATTTRQTERNLSPKMFARTWVRSGDGFASNVVELSRVPEGVSTVTSHRSRDRDSRTTQHQLRPVPSRGRVSMPPNMNTVPIGIRKLKIENFRGVEELKLSFLTASETVSEIVVLAGPNGCGKTTVLEACLLAAGHQDIVRGAIGREGVREGAADYQVTASISTPYGEYDTVVGSDGRPTWKNTSKAMPSSPVSVPCLYFSSWRGPKLVGPVSITAGQKSEQPGETETNRVWLVKQYLVNAKAHAFMREASLSPNTSLYQYETIIQRLNSVWASFYPGSKQEFTVEPLSDDPEAGFDVFLSISHGGKNPFG